ncbi:E3 SUMO-protein ligase KIAA1586-like [Dreissena polymorpha]|uniref:E3 SUMO-protein ligase KIAA1586-like n=1 Tax=Dreissena polymorpha TaxID=45954 RepID=UPI00226462AA|nr:E3 SUMO-protein ligase KIAA1586-like [Dreissena polymorpha]
MEAVYLRTCTYGRIEDSFLHLGSAESACSEDIFKFLVQTLNTLNVEESVRNKLVGFSADGASNMQGLNKGVAALLKQRWPSIVMTHCLVHHLELSFKDAVKKASPGLYEKATTLLLGLYYLFRKSPKEKKGLLRTFEALGERQLLPTRIGGTRWLPHYMKAITIFLKTYKVVRYHLENSSHKNAKAE